MNYFCKEAKSLAKTYKNGLKYKTTNGLDCFFGLSKEDWHDQALNILSIANKEPDNAKRAELYETVLLIICKFLT